MMKTTLALATMVAVASAASVATTKSLDEVQALVNGAGDKVCAAPADVVATVAVEDAYKLAHIDIVTTGAGVAADVTACFDAIKAANPTAALVTVAACLTTADPITSKYTIGADKACPLAFDATCAVGQKCQADDGVADVACPAALKCPAKKVDVVNYLQTQATYSENYKTAEAKIPGAFGAALTAAFTEAKLDSKCGGKVVAFYPTDKKGRSLVSIVSTEDVVCVPADVKKAYETAITAFNKDKADADKVDLKIDKIELKATVDVEKCTVGDDVVCKRTSGCDIPCSDGAVCTKNEDCGSSNCQPGATEAAAKVCASSAFSVLASAVVAAALAVAFF